MNRALSVDDAFGVVDVLIDVLPEAREIGVRGGLLCMFRIAGRSPVGWMT